MTSRIDSLLIPFNHISVSNEFTTDGINNKLYFILIYGENYFEFEGEVSKNTNGTFSFRSSQFPKSNFGAKWQLSFSSNIFIIFEIDTSIPYMSKFGLQFHLWTEETEIPNFIYSRIITESLIVVE